MIQTHLKTSTLGKATGVGSTRGVAPTSTPVTKKPDANAAFKSIQAPQTGPIKTSINPDGSTLRKADSGMQVVESEGKQTVSIPGQKESITFDGEKAHISGDPNRGVSVTKGDDGPVLSFADEGGNTVNVEPNTMFHSVTRPYGNGGVDQVFSPEGHQEIIAYGHTKVDGKSTRFAKSAIISKDGEVTPALDGGFSSIENGKIKFKLGEAEVSRPLGRSMSGETLGAKETKSAAGGGSSLNEPLLAEDPHLANMAATAPAKEKAPLTSSSSAADIFDSNNDPDNIQTLKSGVTIRTYADSNDYSVSLPTGDKFSVIDGGDEAPKLKVLSADKKITSPRLVATEKGPLIAFKDEKNNQHRFNLNDGSLTIGSKGGKAVQTLHHDGTQDIQFRGEYSTDAEPDKPYHYKARFAPDGSLVGKEGMDQLKIDGKNVSFVQPNGNEIPRTLPFDSGLKFQEKAAPEPDSAEALMNKYLGRTPNATTTSSAQSAPGVEQVQAAQGVNQAQAAAGVSDAKPAGELPESPFYENLTTSPSGVSRMNTREGGVKTTLPNGISFTDNGEGGAKVVDAQGNDLKFVRESWSNGKQGMTAWDANGNRFTIGNDHMDFMAYSNKNGEVSQTISADGSMLTNIKDKFKGPDGKEINVNHLMPYDPAKQQEWPSHLIVREGAAKRPDALVAQSPEGLKEYAVPYPLPQAHTMRPPGFVPGPHGQNPGHQPGAVPSQGVRPSFWQKAKSFFTDEPIPQNGQAGHHAPPSYLGGMPTGHYQQDPLMASMERDMKWQRRMTTISMIGMTVTSVLPMLFFGSPVMMGPPPMAPWPV